MEALLANIVGKTRRERLLGKDYLVAPLSLIVPGVLNGSKGPLLYTPEDLGASPARWNGMPIVLYHPSVNGMPVSARDPDILNSSGLGMVLRARFQDKLTAEGWFDVDTTGRVAPEVLNRLERGEPIELSTGLFTDNEPAAAGSVFNGTPYDFIARNHQPDHLAILPEGRGACSLGDGCGVLVNVGEGEYKWAKVDDDTNHGETKMTEQERKAMVDSIIANCDCWEEADRETLNKFPDARLTKEKERVDKALQRTAVVNAALKGFTDPGGATHTWDEAQAKWVTKPAPAKKAEEETPAVNAAAAAPPKPQTTDEWLASAPAEVQSAVRNAMALEAAEKQRIIGELTAHITNEENKKQVAATLNGQSLEQLRIMHLMKPAATQQPAFNYTGAAAPGQPAAAQQPAFDKNDVLPLPTMNWAECDAKAG